MTFLNLVLLLGAAAAAAPLIIHLFSRSRHKIVPWAAMHLLEPALHRTRRKLRVERWLLLLIRALIPALLAFSFAQPVLTGWKALPGDVPTSAVILLDDSYSMRAGAAEPGFRAALREADRILASLPDGSDATVLLVGGRAPRRVGEEATRDLDRLRASLAAAEAEQGPSDTAAAIRAAATILATAKNAHRDLILLSDFQKLNWDETGAAPRQQAMAEIGTQSIVPAVTLLRPSSPAASNIAVEAVELSPALIGAGQRLTIRATLGNSGETPAADLPVYLRIDGQERGQTRINLGPHQHGQALFSHTFRDAGPHTVEVRTDPDALDFDNAMIAALDVRDAVPVLLIDGAPSPDPLRGETDFLAVALQPGQRQASLLRPRVVAWDRFTPADIGDASVIALANVPRLTEPQRRALEDFARAGGGLLIFTGDRTTPDTYNRDLYDDGRGLLPLPIGPLVTAPTRPGAGVTIAPQNSSHPAISPFNDPRNGNLADARLRAWRRVVEPPADTRPAEGQAVTLARLTTGDAALVEKPFGEGKVILCATAADADWSDFPLQPVYVPLVQQLVLHLAATAEPPRNVALGEPLMVQVDTEEPVTITNPAGETQAITLTDGAGEYAGTQRPGIYTLKAGNRVLAKYAVNSPRAESDLAALTDDELLAAAAPLQPVIVRSAEEFRRRDHERRFGREIWLPVFWAVVALLFLEMLVRQGLPFTARKPAPAAGAAA